MQQRIYLRFIGGPFQGKDYEYRGKLVDGPRTWGVAGSKQTGYYQRRGDGPDANGIVTMVWQPKAM